MKISIESTKLTQNDDPSSPGWRVWSGVTEKGTPCNVFVLKVAVATGMDASAYDELSPDLYPAVIADQLTALYAKSFV